MAITVSVILVAGVCAGAALSQAPESDEPGRAIGIRVEYTPDAESARESLEVAAESSDGQQGGVSTPLPGPASDYRSIDRTGEDVTIEAGDTVGDVRVASGILTVHGTVAGKVSATNASVTVEDGGWVREGVRSIGGPVVVAPGGVVSGDVTVVHAEALVQSGGAVEGALLVVGGERRVEQGARIGAQPGEGDGRGFLALGAVLAIAWFVFTPFGLAMAYAIATLAGDRVSATLELWRARPGATASWAIALVGLVMALLLIVCAGWLILSPLALALGCAGALGWVALLKGIGCVVSRGRDLATVPLVMRGFAVWALLGLLGVFPCFFPLVLAVKAVFLVLATAATLLSDWGRDRSGGGCWPIRQPRPDYADD